MGQDSGQDKKPWREVCPRLYLRGGKGWRWEVRCQANPDSGEVVVNIRRWRWSPKGWYPDRKAGLTLRGDYMAAVARYVLEYESKMKEESEDWKDRPHVWEAEDLDAGD